MRECSLFASSFRGYGFKTVFCCSGHGKTWAYIDFSTKTNLDALAEFLDTLPINIKLIHKRHHKGGFLYGGIQFKLEDMQALLQNRKEELG